MIKVLHTEWSDGWGGQEIRIINEMIAVREKGVEVYLACREQAQIREKAIENNIKVFTLPFKGSFDFLTICKLTSIIKQHNINIVNTHSGIDTWIGGFASKLAKVKFIRTRHLSNRIGTSRLNFINELADFIFTTGENVKKNMINNNRINPDRIMSIPTGIDSKIFNPDTYDKNDCRKHFGIKNDEFVIGIVAVLRSFKRHDNFLIIAKKLIEVTKNKKLKFIIAGEGPTRKFIEKQIKELNIDNHVVMIGHIENVPQLLKAIDIFILTSDKNEGVPQSLIQALMMETDSVSTTAGSIQDLYYENNFLISEPTIEKIFNNMNLLINENLTLKHNRNYIIDNFSKESTTKHIIEIYNKLTITKKNY